VAQRIPVTINKPKSEASAAFSEVSNALVKTPTPKTDTLKFFDNVGGK
jgi:MinD-like ATPase involved in chromosome partitioning or flagellar assembly